VVSPCLRGVHNHMKEGKRMKLAWTAEQHLLHVNQDCINLIF
jgi:hypothetical protein